MKARGRSAEPGRGQRGASRDSSVSSGGREVRCACQFFQTDSLLPERVTLLGRPPSRSSTGAGAAAATMATHVGDHEYEPISPPGEAAAALAGALGAGAAGRLPMDAAVEAELGSPRGPFARTDSDEKRERRFLRIPLDDELVTVPGDGADEDAAMRSRELGNGEGLDASRDEDDAAGAAAAPSPAAGASVDDDADGELSAQDIQARIEERFFAATPTTTESRTDCDVNTSQLDSSGLEDLPLKRDARKKKAPDEGDAQSQARGLQQRIRSQAGRLRSKLRSMSRPKFSMPERPKFTMPERPKFHLPERPKFSLPERPKFNLPERPKFNLPERPKFSFPERPKFNFPDRPKFSLPERPKFNLPQRPKLSMPTLSSLSRSSSSTGPKKTTSSTKRPLRDRPSTLSSGSSSTKRTFFDFDLRTYPRIFDRKVKSTDYVTSSPKATRGQTPPPKMPSRRKGPVGSRWVHRFTDIKYADDENVPPKDGDAEADAGLDVSVEDLGGFDERRGSGHTESTTAFRDKDYAYALRLEGRAPADADADAVPDADAPPPPPPAAPESLPESDREQRSSGSSSDRRRAGVLEEIDSDEFFLREKGLSQEDVDVGRYLTSEIRDAFRSPVSALARMDKYDYYDEDDAEHLGQRYRATPEREPTRPARTRSLRPRKRDNASKTPSPEREQEREHEPQADFFNTFPPARPKRARRQPKPLSAEEQDEEKDERQEEERPDGDGEGDGEGHIVHEYVEKMDVEDLEAAESALRERGREEAAEEEPKSEGAEAEAPLAPLAPRRRNRSRQLQDDGEDEDVVLNGHYTKEDWLDSVDARMDTEEEELRGEPDYIVPAAPQEGVAAEGVAAAPAPVPPKRGRRRSSRGASLADEERTSRAASSLPSERDADAADVDADEEEEPDEDLEADAQAAAAALEAALDAAGGYASVDKQVSPARPERPQRPRPPRPPPPGRRRRSNGGPRHTANDVSHFFSLPRRALRAPPVRPVRNYSTLGPARPPRRRPPPLDRDYDQAPDGEPLEQPEQPEQLERSSAAYMEIEDAHGSARDLQSGDVIEKMKARPLPPPPRPPRKAKDEEQGPEEREQAEEPAERALGDAVLYARQEETQPFQEIDAEAEAEALVEELRRERERELEEEEVPEEVSVATQTDPLPDDVCVEAEPHEAAATADASTETPHATLERSRLERTVIEQAPPPPPEPVVVEKPVPYYVMPDPDTEVELKAQRLQVSELDVERLNVGELQAQKILVSDIDGMTMQVAELSSKSGHLVVSGVELPSGFLQELVDTRIAAAPPAPAAPVPAPAPTVPTSIPDAAASPLSAPTPAPAAPQQPDGAPAAEAASAAESLPLAASAPTLAPAAAPLAAPLYLSHALHALHSLQALQGAPPELLPSYVPDYFASLQTPRAASRPRPPPSLSARDADSEEEAPPARRRRHARPQPAPRYSSDEEEDGAAGEHLPPSRRHRAHAVATPAAPAPPDASALELGRRLVAACHAAALRAVRHTLQYATSQLHDQEDKRRELQLALCLLLLLVAGLVLLGCFGSAHTHHHHWDFFFPPSR